MNNSPALRLPSMDFNPATYEQQLLEKNHKVRLLLSPLNHPEPEIFSSPKQHYRMRAEFKIWHDKTTTTSSEQSISTGSQCRYVMFDKENPKKPITITAFPIAHQSISNAMMPLLQAINTDNTLREKLFQVEFLCSSQSDLLITLIYHKPLNPEWEDNARLLEKKLNCHIIGRSRKQRIVLSKETVQQTLTINQRKFSYLQPENSFSQPNASINQAMISWVCNKLALQETLSSPANNTIDLLEMYCGNGNFTLPLSQRFRHVLATEISKSSIAFAKQNCEKNKIHNIEFVRLSGEETAAALKGEREFRRLAHLNLSAYNLQYVLVDPPRAGLDEKSLEFIRRFNHIIYISCNPTTLVDNLTSLASSHDITELALFDQFPYTDHCECGVFLKRKTSI